MKDFLTNNTNEKWEEIKTHPFYEKEREELLTFGEEYLSSPVPPLSLSSYLRFMKDGNRLEYERPYFERRRRIARLAILVRLYGEKYLDALEDIIWTVCEESTWVVPAHLYERYSDAKERETFLDLFATETGALLSLVHHILGDRLSAFVREKIALLVRSRIIDPYFKNHYWWMEGRNNWGSVCASQVAYCLMEFGTEEEFRRAEPSFNRTMNLFLGSYGKDGCCLEGLGYWSYGFGSFLNYADAVRNYSEGKTLFYDTEETLPEGKREAAHDMASGIVDYFRREDVKKAALFAQNIRLTGDLSVSFSDGGESYHITRSHVYLLKREYPNEISYPNQDLFVASASAGSLGILHHFLWSDPEAEYGAPMKEETVYYEEGQWFIHKNARYSFAAKGGHNEEAHNHNDVGSFLISTKMGSTLCDLGSGEYTRQYFNDATRYDYLVCSSRGHSLPIINGEYQKKGKILADARKDGDGSFTVHFAHTYEIAELTDAVRTFTCDASGVTVTDRFSFEKAPVSLTERFVSRKKPTTGDGTVKIENALLSYNKDLLDLQVATEEYNDHAGLAQPVYLIDFAPKELKKELSFVFRIDILD